MGLHVDKGIERAEREARLQQRREDAEVMAGVIVPAVTTAVAAQVKEAREAFRPEPPPPLPPLWRDRGVIAGVIAAVVAAILSRVFGN